MKVLHSTILKSILQKTAASPGLRMTVLLIGSLIWSVAGGYYTNSISPGTGAEFSWRALYSGGHALILLVTTIAWLGLNLVFKSIDEDVMKFDDDKHCRAFIRKANLEAYARSLNSQPATLKPVEEFMRELNIPR